MSRKRLPRFIIDQLLGISMIRRNQQASTGRERSLHDASNACIDGFNRFDRCLDHACVTNHICIGIVHNYQVILSAADMLHRRIGYTNRAHLRLQVVGWHFWRRHQQALLTREGGLASPIDKIGHVGVFLGLGSMELAQPGFRDHPCQRHLHLIRTEGYLRVKPGLVFSHHYIF